MPHTLPKYITIDWLRERAACPAQVERVQTIWKRRKRIPLTHENLLLGAKNNLDLDWFADKLFAPYYADTLDKFYGRTVKAFEKADGTDDDRLWLAFRKRCADVIWDLVATIWAKS